MTREDASTTTSYSISTTFNGDTKSLPFGAPALGALPTTGPFLFSPPPTVSSNATRGCGSIHGAGSTASAFSSASGGEGLMRLADWLTGQGGFGPPPRGGSNNSCCEDPTQQSLLDDDDISENNMTDSQHLTPVAAALPARLQRKLKKWTTGRQVQETAEELMSKIDSPRQSRFRSPCAGGPQMDVPRLSIRNNFQASRIASPSGIKGDEPGRISDPFLLKSAPDGGNAPGISLQQAHSNRQQNQEPKQEQPVQNSREIRHHSPVRRREATPARVPAKRRSASVAPPQNEDPSARYRFPDTAAGNYLSQLMGESRQGDLPKMGLDKLPRRKSQQDQAQHEEQPLKRAMHRDDSKQIPQQTMQQVFEQQEEQYFRQQSEQEKLNELKQSSSSSFACTSIVVESTGSASGMENELSQKPSFRFPVTPPKRDQTMRQQQRPEASCPAGSVDGGGSSFTPQKGDAAESRRESKRFRTTPRAQEDIAGSSKPLDDSDARQQQGRGGLEAPSPRRKPNFLLRPTMAAKSAALRNLMSRAQNPLLAPPMTALQRRFQAFKETQPLDRAESNAAQKAAHSDSSRRTSPFPTRSPKSMAANKYATDFPAYEESPGIAARRREGAAASGASAKSKAKDGHQRYFEMNQQAQALLKPLSQIRENRLQGAGTVTPPRSLAANKTNSAYMQNLMSAGKLGSGDKSSQRNLAPSPAHSPRTPFSAATESTGVHYSKKASPKRVPMKDPREEMASLRVEHFGEATNEASYQSGRRYTAIQVDERIPRFAQAITPTMRADMNQGSGDHAGVQYTQSNFKGPALQKRYSPLRLPSPIKTVGGTPQRGSSPQATSSSWHTSSQESLFTVLVREVKRFVQGAVSSFWNSLHLDEPLQLSPFSPRYQPPPSNYRPPSGDGIFSILFGNQGQEANQGGQQTRLGVPRPLQYGQPRNYNQFGNHTSWAQRTGERDFGMVEDSPHEIRYISPNRLGCAGMNPELSLRRPHLMTSRVADRNQADRGAHERGKSYARPSRTSNTSQRVSRPQSGSPMQESIRGSGHLRRRDPGLHSPRPLRSQYQQRKAVRVPGSSRGIIGHSGDYGKGF